MNNPVSFRTKSFVSAITRPANTTAYADGDCISAADNSHLTFGVAGTGAMVGDEEKLGRQGFLSGVINRVILHSSANQTTKLDCDIYIYHTDIAEVADNAAFAPTDAEGITLVTVVEMLATYGNVGNASAGASGNWSNEANNLDRPYATKASGQLFAQIVARNAYTPVSGETFTVEIIVTRD